MMIRCFLVWFGVLLGACGLLSAQQRADSLRQELKGAIHDTVRAQLLIELAGEVYMSKPEEAMPLVKKAYALSEQIHFDNGVLNALGWQAFLEEQRGNIDEAVRLYQQSAEVCIRVGNEQELSTVYNNLAAIEKDQGNIAQAYTYNMKSLTLNKRLNQLDQLTTNYNNIGLLYFQQGKLSQALESYQEGLRICEEHQIENTKPELLQNLGEIHLQLQQFEEALRYFRRAQLLQEQVQDNYSVAYTLNSIGNLYNQRNMPDTALSYYQRSLALRRDLDDPQGIAYSLKNIGIVMEAKGDTLGAEKNYRESLKIFENLRVKHGMAICSNKLGRIWWSRGEYAAARPIMERAYVFSMELGFPEIIRDAADNLRRLYRSIGDWEASLDMNDVYNQMRDSLQKDEYRKNVYKTQFQVEYAQKEAELKRKEAIGKVKAERQQQLMLLAIAGVLVLGFFSVMLFRQRNKVAHEKENSERLLLNILPAGVAEELKRTGSSKARRYDEVTVMFTDFTNFTKVSESLSAEALVEEIHRCYSRFDEITAAHGLEKIKTIGDSYMAAAGLPQPSDTHAMQTVRAAIEIQQFVQAYFKTSPLGQFGGSIRIGIHTGAVVAGIVGTRKFAYDIWGDTVNIAARMEQTCEAGKINISERTYAIVKDSIPCIYRGKVEAKNKGQIDMYFVEV